MLYPKAVEVFIHTFLDLLGKGNRRNTGKLQLVLFVFNGRFNGPSVLSDNDTRSSEKVAKKSTIA